MLKTLSITYNCSFEHDDDKYHCTAEILEHNPSYIAFQFKSDITGGVFSTFILGGYSGKRWLINITDDLFVFITDPLNISSTIDDLQEIDDIEEDLAEELALIIHNVESQSLISFVPCNDHSFTADDLPF